MLHIGPARIEANPRLGDEEYFVQSQHEASVGLVVPIGTVPSRKHQLRGRFLATCPYYTLLFPTNQLGPISISLLENSW